MSIYKKLAEIGAKYIARHKLFKHGFNLSPMYRRSTGRIVEVTKDLLLVRVRISLSYRNRNYVNSIFGGSMFSSVDPIPMVQLIQLLGDDYVVWDKSAEIYFKRPAREDLYADFTYSEDELKDIKQRINRENELEITKTILLTNKNRTITYCEVKKRIYVADKSYFKMKRKGK